MNRQTEALSNLITLKLGKCLLIVKLIDAEKTMSEHDLSVRASVYGLRTDSALTAKMLENLLPQRPLLRPCLTIKFIGVMIEPLRLYSRRPHSHSTQTNRYRWTQLRARWCLQR